jgi:hypothetical protein
VNQFVDQRPPLNQSKQALSNMLRQRHPGANPGGVPFNIQQQQRMQMIQNRGMAPMQRAPMIYRARAMGGKPMNNQAMMNQQTTPMNPMSQQAPVNVNMPMQIGNNNPNQAMMNQSTPNPMNQQMVMGQQNVMQQVPANQTIMPGPGSGGIPMQQNPPNMMQQQAQGGGQIMGANMPTQQQNQMIQQQGQMGNMGNQMAQGVSGNQNQMFPNQYQNQMNQNYSGYNNNPQMGANQGNVQAQGQTPMMGNFQQQSNPMTNPNQQRNHQAEFLAQQRRQQLMQQQQAQQAQQQQGQQQTPNVTMNANMQGNVPPPYVNRGGKPNMNPNIQFQMRQRAMMTQQQQGKLKDIKC